MDLENLEVVAGGDSRLRGLLYLAAVLTEPNSRQCLELFLAHRYFSQIYLGEVAPEMLGNFTHPSEKQFLSMVPNRTKAIQAALGSDPYIKSRFSEMVADGYVFLKFLKRNPEVVLDKQFWNSLLEQIAVRYPGQEIEFGNPVQMKWLNFRQSSLFSISEVLLEKSTVVHFDISYRGMVLATWKKGQRLLFRHPALVSASAQDEAALLLQRRLVSLTNAYFTLVPESMLERDSTQFRYEILPLSSRGEDIYAGNLTWDLHLLAHRFSRQVEEVRRTYPRAQELLRQIRGIGTDAESLFAKAMSDWERDVVTPLAQSIKFTEDAWVAEKFRAPLSADDETKHSQYAKFKARSGDLSRACTAVVDQGRRLNALAMRLEEMDWTDDSSVNARLTDVVKKARVDSVSCAHAVGG